MKSRLHSCEGPACPLARTIAQGALIIGIAAVSVTVPALAQVSGLGPPLSLDQLGVLESSSTNNFNTGTSNGFFAKLGTNGRTCGYAKPGCHSGRIDRA